MKYYLVRTKTTCSGYEFYDESLFELENGEDIHDRMEEYLKTYYIDEGEKCDGYYSFFGGEIHVEWEDWTEINEEHYNILSQYI